MDIQPSVPYILRPMTLEDIDDVLTIERTSFPMPWPASAFRYDLTQNRYAHYLVVGPREPQPDAGPAARATWWQRFWHAEREHPLHIFGYAGLWCLVDEGHISNIAVAPEWRGHGLGELLLAGLIQRSIELSMRVCTLEVRVTNAVAQNLYRKYGFEIAGRRRGYYSDNGEDALIMSTGLITSEAYRQRLEQLVGKLLARLEQEAVAEE